jgi:hypothetical protein
VWTGAADLLGASSGASCTSWTSGSAGQSASYTVATDSFNFFSNPYSTPCNSALRLFCVQP